MPVPASLSWAEAGGLPEVFTTAHDALFSQAGLATGDRVCWCMVPPAGGGHGRRAAGRVSLVPRSP